MFENKTVLVITAHLDDSELCFGGLIHRFKDVSDFHVLTMTNKYDVWRRDYDTEQQVVDASEQSRKILGIKKNYFGGLREGFVDKDMYEPVHCIEYHIEKIRPNIILTHYEYCCHQDHRACFRATEIAARFFEGSIFGGEVQESTDKIISHRFDPNFFVSLREEDVVAKARAMSCYKTELRYQRNEEGIRKYASFRGMFCGSKFAEALKLYRGVLNGVNEK